MNKDGNMILQGLASPGRTLVFIDDSGTPGKPLPELAKDFHLLCGLVISSEGYLRAKAEIASTIDLRVLGVQEFHANEIVNPKQRSAWRAVSCQERLRILSVLFSVIDRHVTSVLHIYISGEQFERNLRHLLPQRLGNLTVKDALFRVFIKRIHEELTAQSTDIGVVMDAARDMPDEMDIHQFADPTGFYENGLIKVDSRHEPGVQIADLVAYAFNRLPHSRSRAEIGKENEFDKAVNNGMMRIGRLYQNLLDYSTRQN